VRQETLDFLANNPFYTKRFVYIVGKRCRSSSIKDVAKEYKLDWKTVKEFEKEYMREQLEKAPEINPGVIGVDEITVSKGHNYQIIVSDLERGRPIWFGGKDRSEESMDLFYKDLGEEKCRNIRLILMDMWKAFEASAAKNAPNADILYDKFHVIRHLGEALDEIRKSEYRRLSGADRKYIKGNKWILLSNNENLTHEGKESLRMMLNANRRLQVAYLLKESFEQLWDYRSEAWARKFFENWKQSLKWQKLKPYEKFARMIERHWDGIEAYCKPENKVSLGFVEGFNNKIRVIQRRAYGLRDKEYLRLKILTCMLPEL
jgi:transposase